MSTLVFPSLADPESLPNHRDELDRLSADIDRITIDTQFIYTPGPVSIMHRQPYAEKKSLNFSNTLRVVLIPSRGEYKTAGLNPSLWWTGKEFKEFQKTSNAEILLMAKYENIDVRSARKKLYQPSECEDSQTELIHKACAPPSQKNDEIMRRRLNSDDSDYDYFEEVEEEDSRNDRDDGEDSDSDNENSRSYKLKKHVKKSMKKMKRLEREQTASGLPVIHSPVPHGSSSFKYSPTQSPQPKSYSPFMTAPDRQYNTSPSGSGSLLGPPSPSPSQSPSRPPSRPQSPSVLPPGLRVRGDEVWDPSDLQSVAGLNPVSSLDNISEQFENQVEEVNMFFGSWENAQDDLALCVPLKEEISLVSFEKMHKDLQSNLHSGKSAMVQHKAAGPGLVSAGIAVVSAVLLAMVVLTSSGVS
jgi:hypothetical protein